MSHTRRPSKLFAAHARCWLLLFPAACRYLLPLALLVLLLGVWGRLSESFGAVLAVAGHRGAPLQILTRCPIMQRVADEKQP